ncbi:VOC family protein [Actinoallomurus acanthiterrae]
MQVTSSAVSLTVDDVAASAAFLTTHFGFKEAMAAEGFASLCRDDAAMDVIFLRRGIEVLPEGFRDRHAAGIIVALVVTDLAAEEARLRAEGVAITMPLREEPWGERLFQVTDPNGVIVQLVEWVTPSGQGD